MMRRRPLRKAAAFTLLEVMVAVFLLGFVVAAVYSCWNAVVKGAVVGRRAAADVQRSRIAIKTIEDALSTVRMFVADAEYYAFEAENGSKAYISFVSNLPQSFPRGGKFGDFTVRRVTFGLEPGPGSDSQLVLRQIPLLMDIDIDEREHPVVLAQNIKKFELEFWDKRNGEWLDEWTQTNQLPPMVKFTLQFASTGMQSRARDEITQVVALPSIAVPTVWQKPGQPGQPNPGGPGTFRPGQSPTPTQ